MFKTYILFYTFLLYITSFYKVYAQLNRQQTNIQETKPLIGQFTSIMKRHIKLRATNESATLPPCNEDELMAYLAEIQAINPESIINLSTADDLSVMCIQVSGALDKMDQFLEKCKIPEGRDLYIQLIRGVDSLYDYLCNNTANEHAFQKYFSCYHSLHVEYEACSGPVDWTECSDTKKVCKIYKDIIDCYYTKTAELCGLKAACVMKELIKHVINSILMIECDVRANPTINDPMPEAACTHRGSLFYILVMTTLMIIINLR